jgi:G3E family GTPase
LIPYLFEKQLQDAQLLVLTKLDTLQPRQRAELLAELARSLPGTGVLGISARTGEGMPELLDSVLAGVESHTPPGVLSIDYQTYANAEAELAWLNGEVSIRARSTDPARSVDWLRTFTTAAAQECVQRDLWVGHVKAYLDTGAGASKASVLRAGEAPSFDMEDVSPVVDARLLINARVRARPPDLDRLVRASLARADDVHRTSSSIRALRCFSPPPPRPTHRLVTP